MREGVAVLWLDAITLENDDFRLDAGFIVSPGRHVAVMGPSGAGKSTLVNAIAGFQDVSAGRILWEDIDITGQAPGKRPVAMLFQDGNLFPHMTIRENAALGLRPDLKLTDVDWVRVDVALENVGLAGLGNRKPAALSGGQQSRAALARVLTQSRPIVILDEPFAALGPALKAEMLDLVKRITTETGATLLMVTHAPEDALRIADQTILVADGCARTPVATDRLFADPPPALRAYLG